MPDVAPRIAASSTIQKRPAEADLLSIAASAKLFERANLDLINLTVERHADDRNHVVIDLHGDRDIHHVVALQAGDHRAVELGAADADHHFRSGHIARYDVEALSCRAVKERALIASGR